VDVPGDQGGFIYLSWLASRLDSIADRAVTAYTIWRAIGDPVGAKSMPGGLSLLDSPAQVDFTKAGSTERRPAIWKQTVAEKSFYWELIDQQDASFFPGYGMAVPTLFDSTSVCPDEHFFMVAAHGWSSTAIWISEPAGGRSLDNLPPIILKRLAGRGSYSPEGLDLSWGANEEADLAHYTIHRGTAPGFIPSVDNLVATTQDSTLFDEDWSPMNVFHFKVAAVDIHENVGPFAMLTPAEISGVAEGGVPQATFLDRNYPNPFNPTTVIAFGFERPTEATLKVYDLKGQLVRVLAEERFEARRYSVTWNGLDDQGRTVPSGMYVCRLVGGETLKAMKMTLVR
jgi:flagellar hook capping protein FlgD